MNKEQIFTSWAPDNVQWSRWAKPVLFSNIVTGKYDLEDDVIQTDNWTYGPIPEHMAVIVDLPGKEALLMAFKLAGQAFRPVPLYNCNFANEALIDVEPLMLLLEQGAPILKRLNLPLDAPPAFLLDANRMQGEPKPGFFDNRWMTFPQDFPSANYLLSQKIAGILLLQESNLPAEDLAHVLMRWQDAGLKIYLPGTDEKEPLVEVKVRPPKGYRSLWQRMLVTMGLHRNSAGGFGAIVPTPGSHGAGS